ncbi:MULTISPECIES: restriction endonuclease subunit S [unclassified Exiguobacterium]|uniref:restriction endonuclease subunit S n=1 Tax=unclassified Exiguobacterium TaxID=2644629 RepID=UPI001BE5C0C2|nr:MULTISPECIES: restriction endonuclease subunit S [unclassified Exiguobacterium]
MNANQVKKSLLQLAFSGELILQSNESNKDLTRKEFLNDFSVPVHWETYKLGDFTTFIDYRGRTPKKTSSGVRLITAKNIKDGFINLEPAEFISEEDYPKWMTRGYPQKGNIFFTTEAPLGNVAINNLDQLFATAQRLITIQVNTNCHNKFLFYYLMSNQAKTQILKMATGTTVKGIKTKVLKELIVPLPPLEEQKLISEKIDALLAKVKEYHYYYTNLEEEKKIFPKRLEKSILHYAIQGKLVNQDTSDEPASKLLKQISEQKEQMIKEKIIKKEKSLPPITEEEIPFDIPETWAWVRLKNIGIITSGGTPKTAVPDYWNGNITWITPSDMGKNKNSKYLSTSDRVITSQGLSNSSAQLIPKNSIVYSSRAPIGHINIMTTDYATNQGCKSFSPILVDVEYIYYALKVMTPYLQKKASGTTFKEISGTTFGLSLIPLPPLQEQSRIVKAIEKNKNVLNKLNAALVF